MSRLLTLALGLLGKVVPASARDGLVGDLTELFQERRARSGALAAWAWLTSQVGGTLWRFALRRLRSVFRGVWNVRLEGKMRLTDGAGGWLRQLHRARAYSVLVIAMIAIGVGAVSTVFALVEGVVLRPMPYPDPDRIVSVSEDNPQIAISPGWTSSANYLDWREGTETLESIAMFRGRSVSVGTEGAPPMRMARW